MLTEAQFDLFVHTVDAMSKIAYRGRPKIVRFTCPICAGSAEIYMKNSLRGISRCVSCHIIMTIAK